MGGLDWKYLKCDDDVLTMCETAERNYEVGLYVVHHSMLRSPNIHADPPDQHTPLQLEWKGYENEDAPGCSKDVGREHVTPKSYRVEESSECEEFHDSEYKKSDDGEEVWREYVEDDVEEFGRNMRKMSKSEGRKTEKEMQQPKNVEQQFENVQ
ncbi:hypothetical protein M9H77_04458 [Catharanthus roseus]|uniref:Uncharacterized protein n=1 Tax=Catharanthus roseus TaxID=4058 RepID=A0ACC0CEB1_CATRO|nr:hypothetical protein M9H77_04458 [Catharanthus roseus]